MRLFNFIFLFLVLSSVHFSCEKSEYELFEEKRKNIVGYWVFAEPPTKNYTSYQGNIEDKTIFDGDEKLYFEEEGKLYNHFELVGTWSLNEKMTGINLAFNESNGFNSSGYSYMFFEIINIQEHELEVYHRYYKFDNNKYKFNKL
jgi:hypothetical protein